MLSIKGTEHQKKFNTKTCLKPNVCMGLWWWKLFLIDLIFTKLILVKCVFYVRLGLVLQWEKMILNELILAKIELEVDLFGYIHEKVGW